MASITDIMPASVANGSGSTVSNPGTSGLNISLPKVNSIAPLPSVQSYANWTQSLLSKSLGIDPNSPDPMTGLAAAANGVSADQQLKNFASSPAGVAATGFTQWALSNALMLTFIVVGAALVLFSLYAIFNKSKTAVISTVKYASK